MAFIRNGEREYAKTRRGMHSCQYYAAFCTRYNRKVFSGIYAKAAEDAICRANMQLVQYGILFLDATIAADAVQGTISCPPDMDPQKAVRLAKSGIAEKLYESNPELKKRMPQLWTRRSFIASMGDVDLSAVCRYIEKEREEK